MSKQSDFIDSLLPNACAVQRRTGIPASVMIAQAIGETGWGKYVLDIDGKYSYNLFNIKGEGTNGSVIMNETLEYDDQGNPYYTVSHFRAYNSYEDSFMDYAELICNSGIYDSALQVKNDPYAFARALQDCGYATDPEYADKLISIIDYNNIEGKVKEYMEQETKGVFNDTAGHWAEGDIGLMKEFGIVKGGTDGNFRPDEPITRAEVVVLLSRFYQKLKSYNLP